MKRNFITFEGPEGSGKSTQMDRLHSYFVKKGYACIKTHEPGGTRVGEMIRRIVLGCPVRPDKDLSETTPLSEGRASSAEATRCARDENITDKAELFLILADRAQHTAEVILPALNEGKIVLCDRYNDSTMAYQGYGRGLDIGEVRRMCESASQGLQPDLTFLLDVDVAVGLNRTKKRHTAGSSGEDADRFESEKREFHEKLRAGYLLLAKQEPERIVVLDASVNPDETHRQIVKVTERILSQR